jgi:hypothetical protein
MPKYPFEIVSPQTKVPKNWEADELYDTTTEATERAFNIGCTGCRGVVTNSLGDIKYRPCSSDDEYKRIMGEIKTLSRRREYYDFFPDENLYDVKNSIFNAYPTGFNYKNKVLRRTLSPLLYENPRVASILETIDRIFYTTIESIKQIRNYVNWTVPKNNKNVK